MILIRPDLQVPGPDDVAVVQAKPYGAGGELARVDALVVHETVTRSAAVADSVLRKRGLSVHLVGHEDASVVQHEPLLARCAHAGAKRNPRAIGYELVNPYYPKYLRKGLAWAETIAAPWAHHGEYVLPTPAQAETLARFVAWITSEAAGDARVPRLWPGLVDGRMAMGRVSPGPTRGILAHTYFGHADGAWLVLYAWLRLEAGLSPALAYAEARRRATGVRRIDVRDLELRSLP